MLRVHNPIPAGVVRSYVFLLPPKLFTHSVPTNIHSRAQALTHTLACNLACVFKCLLLDDDETEPSIYIFLHRTFPLLRFFSFGNGMRLSVFFFFLFAFSSSPVANYSRVWSSRSLFNCLFFFLHQFLHSVEIPSQGVVKFASPKHRYTRGKKASMIKRWG